MEEQAPASGVPRDGSDAEMSQRWSGSPLDLIARPASVARVGVSAHRWLLCALGLPSTADVARLTERIAKIDARLSELADASTQPPEVPR